VGVPGVGDTGGGGAGTGDMGTGDTGTGETGTGEGGTAGTGGGEAGTGGGETGTGELGTAVGIPLPTAPDRLAATASRLVASRLVAPGAATASGPGEGGLDTPVGGFAPAGGDVSCRWARPARRPGWETGGAGGLDTGGAGGSDTGAMSTPPISSARSSSALGRSAGFFRIARLTNSCNSAASPSSRASSWTTRYSNVWAFPVPNAGRPVPAKMTTPPHANTSAAAVTDSPRICSGAM
jgi:hypothetical protein